VRAKPLKNLQDYLATRLVYKTKDPAIFEVLDTAGRKRHRVLLTGPDKVAGECSCRRGDFDNQCRHVLLVIMRKGGPHGRGVKLNPAG
jgi:hypothetical protein